MSAAYNKYRTPGTRYDRILTAIENGEPDEAIMAREYGLDEMALMAYKKIVMGGLSKGSNNPAEILAMMPRGRPVQRRYTNAAEKAMKWEEDAKRAKEMRDNGWKMKDIQAKLGRSWGTVNSMLRSGKKKKKRNEAGGKTDDEAD